MRILIVDDNALVRRGMGHVVKEGYPEADIVEAGGASSALDAMRSEPADLALVNIRLPDLDGLGMLRAMKLEWPDVPVIMLSTDENVPYVKRALSDGAAGYLLKDATPEDLGRAIEIAISGGSHVVSPRVIQNLFEDVRSSGRTPNGHPKSRQTEHALTQRERDILALLAEGRSNRSIAKSLYLSEKTVKSHLAAIFPKLGVTNRTQAAMKAVQLGVGPVPGSVTGTE